MHLSLSLCSARVEGRRRPQASNSAQRRPLGVEGAQERNWCASCAQRLRWTLCLLALAPISTSYCA